MNENVASVYWEFWRLTENLNIEQNFKKWVKTRFENTAIAWCLLIPRILFWNEKNIKHQTNVHTWIILKINGKCVQKC